MGSFRAVCCIRQSFVLEPTRTVPIPSRQHITAEPWRSLFDALEVITSADLFLVGFALLVMVINAVFSWRIPEWPWVIFNCTVVIMIIAAVNLFRARRSQFAVRTFHAFYLGGIVPVFFKTIDKMSFAIHGRDFDNVLIAIDRMLCAGHDPTIWLYTHIPIIPAFIEYLQICYSLFYFLPVILAVELYRRRMREGTHAVSGRFQAQPDAFEEVLFIVVYGFCLSYFAYLFLPAVGPRFVLHDFYSIDVQLPGVWFTQTLRNLLNEGENIQKGMSALAARQVVTRDAFPSGHTQLTLITMLLAFKFKAKSRWLLLILGTSLIFSTVYLRYHYVIDVIGGGLFAVITLYTWKPLWSLLEKIRLRLVAGK